MLYKKIHRQHVKEWRLGREFKYYNIHRVTKKPHIEGSYIWMDGWHLISIRGIHLGQIHYKEKITWLD